MTPLQVILTLAVIALFIVQYLHFSYKLKSIKTDKDNYAKDSFNARENYRKLIEEKDKDIKSFKERIKELIDIIESWKNSSEGKQIALDNSYLKIDVLTGLLKYLKKKWYTHLLITENDELSCPSLRLTVDPIKMEYQVKSYQGSRDLNNKTDFIFSFVGKPGQSIDSLVRTIESSLNPVESKDFQEIVNFLNKYNQ